MSQEFLNSKIFGIKWSRLILNCNQTLYMVGWALLIGTLVGLVLALILAAFLLLNSSIFKSYNFCQHFCSI